ncbi:MAG: DUF1045 domain-containing protein [Marinovum sp.]|nr:DUF1045 domain-containing protein [Marinovum sp.]
MENFTRFGIYCLPEGPLAAFGARWLGWEIATAQRLEQDPDITRWTQTPRKYGFHGTMKPPFRLAEGTTADALYAAAEQLAAGQKPVLVPGLKLARLGAFFALVPDGDATALGALTAACVTELDAFRAPPNEAELAKRRARKLTDRQEALLQTWGYPYVLDEFRFHLTLTGRVPPETCDTVKALIEAHLPPLPRPFEINSIGLVGERPDGQFETIARLPLLG